MKVTEAEVEGMLENNYNKILPVYASVEMDNPTAIAPQMDKAIEKVITVATIHDVGNYVDDCYVLMGQAQYMKQDFASAEETFQYFEEEFDPLNPYGREYSKAKYKKRSPKQARKEADAKRKEKDKERKEKEKIREEKRKEEEKARDAERKMREDRSKKSRKKKKKRYKSREDRDKDKQAEEAKQTQTTEISEDTMTKEEREAKRAVEAAAKEAEEEKKRYEEEKAKLKKEEEEKKKKATRPQGEGGIFKNKTVFYEGLYWLARTYIETERFSSAKNIVERLESTVPLDDKVSDKLPAVKAHMLMRTGDYDEALIALDQAIEAEKDKRLKARFAFIKGQIYEKQENTALAYTEYKKAKKYSPDYELKFNAELNELKLSYKTGQISQEKAMARLEKMGKESKNDEFSDQIYFTQAQIRLSSGDVDGAIADFNEAIQATGGKKSVKLEAYYKLAELLYAQGHYGEAKKNYDEALKLMALTDDRYRNAKRLADNLTDIARNMDIVKHQDSLLRMSRLSDSELRELAITELKKQAASKADEPAGAPKRASNIFASGANRSQGRSKTSFFAYNPIALNQGKVEFKRKWGNRVVEDNWRRSLRSDVGLSDVDDVEEVENEEVEITDQEIAEFLREIPTTSAKKTSAEGKIQNALFNLGILFRERLRNYNRSAEALERLEREYPDFEKRDEALFYLYRSYLDLGENSKATSTFNKLKTEFPDSQFTKLAIDPNYAKTMQKGEGTLEAYYNRSYTLFESGQHAAVIDRYNEKGALFPNDDTYDAKFDLLMAMSLGSVEGKTQYIRQLENLVRKHRNTPEEVRAKEILRFLKGDQEAFNEILYEEGKDKFTLDDDKLHYIFVVVYGKDQSELQDIKIAISEYNKKFHRRDNLNISNISLNPESKSHIILIRSFSKGRDQAMAYYNGVMKNREEFSIRQNDKDSSSKVEFDIYAATQKNYREVVKQRSSNEYRLFFEKEYLRI